MSGETWRPLRHSLSAEAVALMAEQSAAGMRQMPVHLMLVDDSGPQERGRTACDGATHQRSHDTLGACSRECLARYLVERHDPKVRAQAIRDARAALDSLAAQVAPSRVPGEETCTCNPAEVESGVCVLCGKPYPVGGSV